jgi:hypothetical protein
MKQPENASSALSSITVPARSNAAVEMGKYTLALRSTYGTRAGANAKGPACREYMGVQSE